MNARDGEEQAVDQVLEIINRLYRVEADAREHELEGEQLREQRLRHANTHPPIHHSQSSSANWQRL